MSSGDRHDLVEAAGPGDIGKLELDPGRGGAGELQLVDERDRRIG